MKGLAFILAVTLLAGCSGMRARSESSGASAYSGASGANEGHAGGSDMVDVYRGGAS